MPGTIHGTSHVVVACGDDSGRHVLSSEPPEGSYLC